MSQGKQTSFGNGEVSPEIHFLSSDTTYANSLSKLSNAYVMYMGGVANRAGTERLYWSPYSPDPEFPSPIEVPQGFITEPGGDEPIIGYGFWNSVYETWDVLEVGYFYDVPSDTFKKGYRVNYGTITFFETMNVEVPEPKDLRFIALKDKILITPSFKIILRYLPPKIGYQNCNFVLDMKNRTLMRAKQDTKSLHYIPPGHTIVTYGRGKAPWFPVSYLFTGTLPTGEEIVINEQVTQGYDPATWDPNSSTPPGGNSNVYLPHADMYNNIELKFSPPPSTDPAVYYKYITVYRAVGAAGINGSMFKMVGRARPELTTSITDHGSSSIEITPPIDFSLTNGVSATDRLLAQINVGVYYQQRLIGAFKNSERVFSTDYNTQESFEVKAGEMVASRVGAPFHLSMPLLINDTDAFQFSPPITDGSEVVAFLSMDRLVAITEKAAYGYMGGDSGAFTPYTTVPVKISDTGCSRTVEPKTVAGRGYYVSSDHSKIIGILWNIDGQLKVFEASKYANHLLEGGIKKIELLSGKEDQLIILKRDGTLIGITINTEQIKIDSERAGFSTFNISDGYVESMYKTRMKRKFVYNQIDKEQVDLHEDVIVMYVVRGGFRSVEVLRPRSEERPETFFYADSYSPFGYRLSDNGLAGYKKIYYSPSYQMPLNTNNVDFHINLGDPSTSGWEPEDTIYLYSESNVLQFHGSRKIIFYYGDEKYPKKFTYTIETGSMVDTGDPTFPYRFSGFVSTTVPEEYRDVRHQAISTALKNEMFTRWCPANYELRGPTVNGLYFSEILKYPDGRVPVSLYGDAQVVSSPLNPNKQNIVAYIELEDTPVLRLPEDFECGWGYIGIPFETNIASMRLETGDSTNTLQSANKLINVVGMGLRSTQGGFVGLPDSTFEDMQEMEQLLNPNAAELPTPKSGYYQWTIPTNYNNDGKVSIKHVDPTPLTLLALYPGGVASGD